MIMIKDFYDLPEAEEIEKLEAEGWELITIVEHETVVEGEGVTPYISERIRAYFRERHAKTETTILQND